MELATHDLNNNGEESWAHLSDARRWRSLTVAAPTSAPTRKCRPPPHTCKVSKSTTHMWTTRSTALPARKARMTLEWGLKCHLLEGVLETQPLVELGGLRVQDPLAVAGEGLCIQRVGWTGRRETSWPRWMSQGRKSLNAAARSHTLVSCLCERKANQAMQGLRCCRRLREQQKRVSGWGRTKEHSSTGQGLEA